MSKKVIYIILGISIPTILILGAVILVMLLRSAPRQESGILTTLESASIETQTAGTVLAVFTAQALQATPSETSAPALTATQTPEIVPTLTFTPEFVLPTKTAIPPTMLVPTFTPISPICDRAQFVRDISVQDNSAFTPGTTFVKAWRLKNIGSCTWTSEYRLVFSSGNAMNADLSIPLPKTVEPNQTVDISVTLKAPAQLGTYRGDWLLSNQSGAKFGIGPNGDQTFWALIRVVDFGNTGLAYDFAANFCQAEWTSGTNRLPCPGVSSAQEGFVYLSDTPRLENRQEDEWAIISHPNESNKGWISGMYPEFVIQPNQQFKAWVGCLDESKGCNVTFRLDFKNLQNGNIQNLGSWQEVFDGNVAKINLDLSQHAGKRVRFILTVVVSGGNPERANAFWFVPGIVNTGNPTATPTLVTPTGSATPTETATPTSTKTPQ